jgi:hypothetical protein
MILRRNVMYRCEGNDYEKIYLFGEKHKHSLKKKTAGEIVNQIRLMEFGEFDARMGKLLV